MNVRKTAVVLAACLLPLSLSACGGQSVDEACKIARTESEAAEKRITEIDPSDPAASAKAVDQVADDLEKSAKKIKNDEVRAVFDKMVDSFEDFADALEDTAEAGTDTDKLTKAAAEMTKIGERLGEQGKAFEKLCGKA